jgi:hypothetical protein
VSLSQVLRLDPSAVSTSNKRGDKPFATAVRNPRACLASLRLLADAHPASLKIKDKGDKFPLQRAADAKRPLEWLVFLFSTHPLNEDRFQDAAQSYLTALLESPPSSLAAFPPAKQDGFVGFVSDGTLLRDLSTDAYKLQDELVAFIESTDRCPIETAKALAFAMDVSNPRASKANAR